MTIMEQQNNGTPTPPRSNPYAGLLWVVLIVLFLNGLIFPNFSGRRIIETDYGTFIGKVDSGLVERERPDLFQRQGRGRQDADLSDR